LQEHAKKFGYSINSILGGNIKYYSINWIMWNTSGAYWGGSNLDR
jgi:hypothetical protein